MLSYQNNSIYYNKLKRMHNTVITLYGIYYYGQCTLRLTSAAATDQNSLWPRILHIRERYRVYGDYDRVRWSVSRLMGFWRGNSGMNLTLPPAVVTANPDSQPYHPPPPPRYNVCSGEGWWSSRPTPTSPAAEGHASAVAVVDYHGFNYPVTSL